MATMSTGDEDGASDIQRIQIKGGDYVLVPAEKYRQLLDRLDSSSAALKILRSRAQASGHVSETPDPTAKAKTAPEIGPKIGDEMEDGTIYAGISPDTGKPLYATPKDAPGTYTFNEAAKYAKNLDAHGHHDFHAPSQGELNVLWENRNKGKLKETFNEGGLYPADLYSTAWYWSSSLSTGGLAWTQHFSGGRQNLCYRLAVSSLRCVR